MAEDRVRTGLIHLYYGDGKGKTTAAMGLATRAAGSGLCVCIVQFMKNGRSSELEILTKQPNVKLLTSDGPCKFSFRMTDEEKAQARVCNGELLERAMAEPCDLLVLDEVVNAYRLDLISHEDVEKAVLSKRDDLELVLTGRKPAPFFIEHADYVTEMVCRKHPYKKGVKARKGVEF